MLSLCFKVFFGLCFVALPVAARQGDILAIVPAFDYRPGHVIDFPETTRGRDGQITPSTVVQCRDVSYRIPIDRSTYYKCCRRNLYYAVHQFCIYDVQSSSAPAMSTPGYNYRTTRRPFNFFHYSTATAANYWPFAPRRTPPARPGTTTSANPMAQLSKVVCSGIAYYVDPQSHHKFRCCDSELQTIGVDTCAVLATTATRSTIPPSSTQAPLAFNPELSWNRPPTTTERMVRMICGGKKFALPVSVVGRFACCGQSVYNWKTHECAGNSVRLIDQSAPDFDDAPPIGPDRRSPGLFPFTEAEYQAVVMQHRPTYEFAVPPPTVALPNNAYPQQWRRGPNTNARAPLSSFNGLNVKSQPKGAKQTEPQAESQGEKSPLERPSCPAGHICCEDFLPVEQNAENTLRCCKSVGPYDPTDATCLM